MLNYLERASDISEAAIEWLRKLSFRTKGVTLGFPSMRKACSQNSPSVYPHKQRVQKTGLFYCCLVCVLGCVPAVVVDVSV